MSRLARLAAVLQPHGLGTGRVPADRTVIYTVGIQRTQARWESSRIIPLGRMSPPLEEHRISLPKHYGMDLEVGGEWKREVGEKIGDFFVWWRGTAGSKRAQQHQP